MERKHTALAVISVEMVRDSVSRYNGYKAEDLKLTLEGLQK